MSRLEKLLTDLAGPPKDTKMIRCADEHCEYLACPIAVLQRPRQTGSPAPGEFSSYGEYPQSRVAAVANITPEVMLSPGALPVEGDDRRRLLESQQLMVVPVAPDGSGLGILPGSCSGGVFRALVAIRLTKDSDLGTGAAHVSLQRPLREACLADPELRLSVTRLRGTASKFVAVVEGGDELLYVLLEADEAPKVQEIVMADGSRLKPDAWNDKDRCYKHVRGVKMKGLGNPITGRRDAAVKQAPEQKPEVSQDDIDKAAAMPVDAKVVAAPPEPQEEPVQPVQAAEPETVPQEPQEPAEQAQEQPKRARRAPQATGKYSVAVLQQLAGDMAAQPDPSGVDQIDAIIDEMRAVRDLQIASARRMANLGTAIAKLTRGAVEKYSQIQALLK